MIPALSLAAHETRCDTSCASATNPASLIWVPQAEQHPQFGDLRTYNRAAAARTGTAKTATLQAMNAQRPCPEMNVRKAPDLMRGPSRDYPRETNESLTATAPRVANPCPALPCAKIKRSNPSPIGRNPRLIPGGSSRTRASIIGSPAPCHVPQRFQRPKLASDLHFSMGSLPVPIVFLRLSFSRFRFHAAQRAHMPRWHR